MNSAVFSTGEATCKKNIEESMIPVLSCEGACARGEIVRLAENRVCKNESYRQGCHRELITLRSVFMNMKESPFPIADSLGRIECKDVLGGFQNKDIEVSAGKVIASIYSEACCGETGGDIYYFGVCKGDLITRLAVADVTGHGNAVSDISRCIYESIKSYM